ncbi:MAG: hypothetical protein WCL46_03410, partial [Chlorobium sp.]
LHQMLCQTLLLSWTVTSSGRDLLTEIILMVSPLYVKTPDQHRSEIRPKTINRPSTVVLAKISTRSLSFHNR